MQDDTTDREAPMREADMPRRPYLQLADLGDLMRFHETTDDDQSYDIGKDACKRLAELGCLQSHGFGRYSITSFGDWVLAHEFEQAPPLPLMTTADFNESQRAQMQARIDAAKGGANA